MHKEQVIDFLTVLGGEVTTTTSNWATCRCIFARFLHEGKVDNHPSSGMTITGGGIKIQLFHMWGARNPLRDLQEIKIYVQGGSTTQNRSKKSYADYRCGRI